jgi:hypothetical protein
MDHDFLAALERRFGAFSAHDREDQRVVVRYGRQKSVGSRSHAVVPAVLRYLATKGAAND